MTQSLKDEIFTEQLFVSCTAVAGNSRNFWPRKDGNTNTSTFNLELLFSYRLPKMFHLRILMCFIIINVSA